VLTITPALSDRELERVFDDGLKRRLITRAAVAGAAARSPWLPGATRRSFESDHARDLELESAGFTVMRFARDQVVHQPELVLAQIAQRIGELTAQVRRSSGAGA
jgi:Protein of unknown function (DUF559)